MKLNTIYADGKVAILKQGILNVKTALKNVLKHPAKQILMQRGIVIYVVLTVLLSLTSTVWSSGKAPSVPAVEHQSPAVNITNGV